MKFVWGILAGSGVVAALGWVLVALLIEPRTPTRSAVVEQPSGRLVAEVAPPTAAKPAQEPTGAPAATAESEAASAAAPAGTAAGEPESKNRTAGSSAGDAGQPERLMPAAPTPPAGALRAHVQATAPAAETTPRPPADPTAPSFDLVRVDASGQTVIAGRAQPEQDVEVLLDGRVVDTVRADASGRFVAVIMADLSGEARQLQLRVTVSNDAGRAGSTKPVGSAAAGGGEATQAGVPPDSGAAKPATAVTGAAVGGSAGAAASKGSAREAGATGAAGTPTTSAAETGGAAVDGAAALPAAPAQPPELALAAPGGGATEGTAPDPAPTAAGAAPRIALPAQPFPGSSVGAAPSADGLRVPVQAGADAGEGLSGGMSAGTGASPGTTPATAPSAPGGMAAAGAAQDGIGESAPGPAPTAEAAPGAAGTGHAQSGTATAESAGAAGGAAARDNAAAGGDAASGAAQGGGMVLSDAAPSAARQEPSPPSAAAAASQALAGITGAPAAPAPGAPPAAAGRSGGGAAAPAGLASAGSSPSVPSPPSPSPEGDGRYLLSAPVLILPAARVDDAPALVQSKSDELALLQPGGDAADPASSGVVLHQITYAAAGDVQMRGTARPRHSVRVYGDGQILGTAPVQGGAWQLSLPRDRVESLSLFRVDEIGPAGQVTSRVEAPFRYTGDRPLVLRDREVVVQRGDNLWEIAEHYYGEGIRYSLIYGANSELIRDPDLIYPDQVFSIPELVEAQ